MRAAQEAGDDIRVCLVQEKAGAIEDLHQAAGSRQSAFREQHEPAVLLQILRHALRGVRRRRVHREAPVVDHDLPVQPARLGGRARHHEPPVVVERHDEKEPVDPRRVIGDEQHRARRLEHLDVVGAEAKEDPHQPAKEKFDHGTMSHPAFIRESSDAFLCA